MGEMFVSQALLVGVKKERGAVKRFVVLVAVAVLASAPAVVMRVIGLRPDPLMDAAIFGVATSPPDSFCRGARKQRSATLHKGLSSLLSRWSQSCRSMLWTSIMRTRLDAPEPNLQYVHYAAANMTGANRLLVGFAWPLLVFLHWVKERHRRVELTRGNAVEVAYLLLASLYAVVILLKGRIALVDLAVLVGIYAAYVWRVRHVVKPDGPDEDEEPGPGRGAATASIACSVDHHGGTCNRRLRDHSVSR